MSAAKSVSQPVVDDVSVSAPMSWDEIRHHYPDQFVCLVEIDRIHPNGSAFRTARVIGHAATRRELPFFGSRVWQKYRQIGFPYTGVCTGVVPRLRVETE